MQDFFHPQDLQVPIAVADHPCTSWQLWEKLDATRRRSAGGSTCQTIYTPRHRGKGRCWDPRYIYIYVWVFGEIIPYIYGPYNSGLVKYIYTYIFPYTGICILYTLQESKVTIDNPPFVHLPSYKPPVTEAFPAGHVWLPGGNSISIHISAIIVDNQY